MKTQAVVDWLTLTATDPERRRTLGARASNMISALPEGIVKRWGWRGYAGLMANGVRWGTREDSDIVIVSGEDCRSLWKVFLPLAQRASRIDLAVDAVFDRPLNESVITEYKQFYSDNPDLYPARVRFLHWADAAGGETLYIGSRSSDQLGRIYDKGAESGLLPNRQWYRYEVEFKDQRSDLLRSRMLLSSNEYDNIESQIQWLVYDWFNKRQFPPVFAPTFDSALCDLVLHVRQSDVRQKLEWLRTYVRPTITKLCDLGYGEQVMEVLGLD